MSPRNTSASTGGAHQPRTTSRHTGLGRIIVAVYGVFALSATARAAYQIATDFSAAPLAYLLSALAAVVYIVATISLATRRRGGWALSLGAVLFELVGVLVVGTLSFAAPQLFAHPAVWSHFGSGYGYIPLLLPLLGLWWLWRHRPRQDSAADVLQS
ncbi:hypothetical protein [Zhihengliuella flava]|uniref:Integral membrane protein n=1 Tax=Zhihengliuella flava TaxID=1285193 RepID=A0A931D4Y1_9MICC|nr:hypothetical protein [Zhihengliuella flava]MBG6083800.1 hypothetical protein [Zhihengliuella flava]